MSDALERIKNRQRPEVPKRDPGMTSTVAQVVAQENSNPDIETVKYPDIQISALSGEKSTAPAVNPLIPERAESKVSRTPDIQISTLPDEISFLVKQTTLRLEKGLSDELQALCQREQICREVLIEAMFLELLNAPELREGIIIQAKERQRQRTAIANHKRALSMVQRVANQP